MKKIQKIVVDSSVIVKWLNRDNENYLDQADKILKNCQNNKITLYTPELAKYEVGNAILSKQMEIPQTKSSLTTLYSLPINFVKLNKEDALDVLELSSENKITYYDAVFVNLAIQLDAELITDNPKHQKVKKVKVIPLENYK